MTVKFFLPLASPDVMVILGSFCLINSLSSAGLRRFKEPAESIRKLDREPETTDGHFEGDVPELVSDQTT